MPRTGRPEPRIRMVAIAGSAGAVGPMRQILSQLPGDFPASLLFLLHTTGPRASKLAEVMQACTTLKVRWARDGHPVERGVTLCPPGCSFTITPNGLLALSDVRSIRDMLRSADSFFSSVARRYGRHAMSIVLSGTSSDGGQGAAAVRARQGIVIAQDEASALIWDMPRAALDTGGVDLVVPLRNIAPTLTNLVRDRHPLAQVSKLATFAEHEDEFISEDDRSLLQQRLTRMCAVHRAERGTLQLVDPRTGFLRIVAQIGFGLDYLHHFQQVHAEDGSSSGRAYDARMPVIIRDIELDPAFAPHREIARAAGFRSVQSTPLISRGGVFMGAVSTYFRTRQWRMEEKLSSDEWRTQCNVAVLQVAHALRIK